MCMKKLNMPKILCIRIKTLIIVFEALSLVRNMMLVPQVSQAL